MTPAARAAYLEALDTVGNPSSIHGPGQAARELLEQGRDRVAAAAGADPVEVVLTGGGTEAVNLAIKGLFWARKAASGGAAVRILATRAEHHATLDAIEWLAAQQRAQPEWIPVDELGRIRLDALEFALSTDPGSVALVTTLWANNEVGTIQPVRDVVGLAHAFGVPVHVDAIAALGQLPIDTAALGAEAVSLSAHKIGGPVGVGALVLARSATVEPLLHGGAQQRGRSGTMDVAGAHAFGVAAENAARDLAAHAAHLASLRDRLIAGLRRIPAASLRGDPDPAGRLPGNVHATFHGCEGDSLLYLLDAAGFAVSTGSACQAGIPEPSHVLLAMGLSEAGARGALRFTLGAATTEDEIDALLAALPAAVEQARAAGLSAGR
ncbi:MAG: cysteine desulfurase [Actinomycetales bacterium]|nr:cysteine desulfurase [Actinomycetales bacterium]